MKPRIRKIVIWPLCFLFLAGFIATGDSKILCIGDDGHLEIETICLPCCGDEDKDCETEKSNDKHEEHGDCSNCSDVELDNSLWLKRVHNINLNHSMNHESNVIANIDYNFTLICNSNSQIIKFHLAYSQSPPSYSVETVILRC